MNTLECEKCQLYLTNLQKIKQASLKLKKENNENKEIIENLTEEKECMKSKIILMERDFEKFKLQNNEIKSTKLDLETSENLNKILSEDNLNLKCKLKNLQHKNAEIIQSKIKLELEINKDKDEIKQLNEKVVKFEQQIEKNENNDLLNNNKIQELTSVNQSLKNAVIAETNQSFEMCRIFVETAKLVFKYFKENEVVSIDSDFESNYVNKKLNVKDSEDIMQSIKRILENKDWSQLKQIQNERLRKFSASCASDDLSIRVEVGNENLEFFNQPEKNDTDNELVDLLKTDVTMKDDKGIEKVSDGRLVSNDVPISNVVDHQLMTINESNQNNIVIDSDIDMKSKSPKSYLENKNQKEQISFERPKYANSSEMKQSEKISSKIVTKLLGDEFVNRESSDRYCDDLNGNFDMSNDLFSTVSNKLGNVTNHDCFGSDFSDYSSDSDTATFEEKKNYFPEIIVEKNQETQKNMDIIDENISGVIDKDLNESVHLISYAEKNVRNEELILEGQSGTMHYEDNYESLSKDSIEKIDNNSKRNNVDDWLKRNGVDMDLGSEAESSQRNSLSTDNLVTLMEVDDVLKRGDKADDSLSFSYRTKLVTVFPENEKCLDKIAKNVEYKESKNIEYFGFCESNDDDNSDGDLVIDEISNNINTKVTKEDRLIKIGLIEKLSKENPKIIQSTLGDFYGSDDESRENNNNNNTTAYREKVNISKEEQERKSNTITNANRQKIFSENESVNMKDNEITKNDDKVSESDNSDREEVEQEDEYMFPDLHVPLFDSIVNVSQLQSSDEKTENINEIDAMGMNNKRLTVISESLEKPMESSLVSSMNKRRFIYDNSDISDCEEKSKLEFERNGKKFSISREDDLDDVTIIIQEDQPPNCAIEGGNISPPICLDSDLEMVYESYNNKPKIVSIKCSPKDLQFCGLSFDVPNLHTLTNTVPAQSIIYEKAYSKSPTLEKSTNVCASFCSSTKFESDYEIDEGPIDLSFRNNVLDLSLSTTDNMSVKENEEKDLCSMDFTSNLLDIINKPTPITVESLITEEANVNIENLSKSNENFNFYNFNNSEYQREPLKNNGTCNERKFVGKVLDSNFSTEEIVKRNENTNNILKNMDRVEKKKQNQKEKKSKSRKAKTKSSPAKPIVKQDNLLKKSHTLKIPENSNIKSSIPEVKSNHILTNSNWSSKANDNCLPSQEEVERILRQEEIKKRVELAKKQVPMDNPTKSPPSMTTTTTKNVPVQDYLQEKLNKHTRALREEIKTSSMKKLSQPMSVLDKLKRRVNKSIHPMRSIISMEPLNRKNFVMERMTKQDLCDSKITKVVTDSIAGTKRMRCEAVENPCHSRNVLPKRARLTIDPPIKSLNKPLPSVESEKSSMNAQRIECSKTSCNKEREGSKLMNVNLGQLLLKNKVTEEQILKFQQIISFTNQNPMLPEITVSPKIYNVHENQVTSPSIIKAQTTALSENRPSLQKKNNNKSDIPGKDCNDNENFMEKLFTDFINKSDAEINNLMSKMIVLETEIDANLFVERLFKFFESKKDQSFNRRHVINITYFMTVTIMKQSPITYRHYYKCLMDFLHAPEINLATAQMLILSNLSFCVNVQKWDFLICFFLDLIQISSIPLLMIIRVISPNTVFPQIVREKYSTVLELIKRIIWFEYNTTNDEESRKVLDSFPLDVQRFWLNGKTVQDIKVFTDVQSVIDFSERVVDEFKAVPNNFRLSILVNALKQKYSR